MVGTAANKGGLLFSFNSQMDHFLLMYSIIPPSQLGRYSVIFTKFFIIIFNGMFY